MQHSPLKMLHLVFERTNNKQKHRGSKMRTKHTHQMSIYEAFSKHEIGRELKAVSDWLDGKRPAVPS